MTTFLGQARLSLTSLWFNILSERHAGFNSTTAVRNVSLYCSSSIHTSNNSSSTIFQCMELKQPCSVGRMSHPKEVKQQLIVVIITFSCVESIVKLFLDWQVFSYVIQPLLNYYLSVV